MVLTELEKDVILAIVNSEYSDSPGSPIWSWSVADNTKITNINQVSGVISSLVKKGLVISSEYDIKDNTVELTSNGIEEYKKIKEAGK